MNLPEVIVSQYQAALEMLSQSVEKCPDSLWDSPDDNTKFWHIAYHALFYTHLYLSESGETFTPWPRHREQYQFLGPIPWLGNALPNIGEPYAPEDVLEYADFCRRQVDETVPRFNLESPSSGFDWLPMNKLELQFYNIRHLQQHIGELMERLGSRAGVSVDWVGMRP